MPERDEVLAKARTLRGHVWTEPEREEDRWIGKAHGATFKLIKPEGIVFADVTGFPSLALILKGKVKGKKILRQDFVSAFGEPKNETPAKRFINPQIIIWDSAKALSPQRSK